MVSHYLFEAEFCNPASGWEKGQIEKNVRDARHRLWQPVPAFATLALLNDWLESRCKALWGEIVHGKLPGSVADVWAQERPLLMQVPRPFDGFVEHTKRVSPTCLVHFERNRYSVPASYANRPVSLRVYAERLVVAAEARSCANTHASSTEATTRRATPCTTGVTTWRCCSASQERSGTEHPSASCRRASGVYRPRC
jgi:hypothetical protein